MTGNVPIIKKDFVEKKDTNRSKLENRGKIVDRYLQKRLESIAKKKEGMRF